MTISVFQLLIAQNENIDVDDVFLYCDGFKVDDYSRAAEFEGKVLYLSMGSINRREVKCRSL